MINEEQTERLKEIILMADKLNWINAPTRTSYSLMQLSEVEKCMIAMIDNNQLETMRNWTKDIPKPEKKLGRCPYDFFSLTQATEQGRDMQCIYQEGHVGEHKFREVLPPPQVQPVQGWIKRQKKATGEQK